MKLWMKKDHGSSLGLVLIFVTIAGMWLGAILLLLQVTSNGPSLTNNEATAAAKVTAGVLDQLKKNSSIGSAAVDKVKCTGLTVPSTSGYTVTCVPVSPAGNAGSPAGIVTTGDGTNPGVDFGTTVTGPLTFDNGLTSTGPITVDPAAKAPVVVPNTPTGGGGTTCSAIYTIASSAGSNGSITPNGSTPVSCNGSKSYSFTPAATYEIKAVTVDSVGVGSPSTYDFSNVVANHTISVTFQSIPSTPCVGTKNITSSAGSNGTISPNGVTAVDCHGAKEYRISPKEHYKVSDVKVDGSSVGATKRYTFSDVVATHTIAATFVSDGGSDNSGCSSDRSKKNANSGKKNSNSSSNSYYTSTGSYSSSSWNGGKSYSRGDSSDSNEESESGSGHSYGQDGSEYVTDHCGNQGGDGEEQGGHGKKHHYGDNDCDIKGAACSDDDESEEASDHSSKSVTSSCSSGKVTIALTAGDYDSTDVAELNKFLNPGSASSYNTTSGSGCKPSSSTVTVTLGDGEYQFSGSQALVLNNAKALVKNANATMTGRTCTYAGGLSALPLAKGVLQSKLHGVLLNMAINMTITAGEMDLCGLNTPTGLSYALRNITPTQAATVASREGASYAPTTSASYNTLTVGPNGVLRIVGAVDAQWTSFQYTANETNAGFITQMAIFKAAHLTTTGASTWSTPYGAGTGRQVQITLVNTKTGAKKSFIVFIDDVNGASVGKSTKILSSTI
ncbi:MAG: hypothetical protein F2927_01105 [Actinobacteria bacterium]|uniref:Unannotated protein n=1 Tax=freshwater metagenome TaxID=449393 RepID=A0A6J7T3E2_9ZZZZ|nr:hypothetical protein [Actinomycetota bacterium]